MIIFIRKLYFWTLIVILSIKHMFKVNCLDEVYYKKEKHLVINGAMPHSWRLDGLYDNDGWVKRKECKKVLSIPNMIGSFRRSYRFYMNTWYGIWIQSGIENWMRNCNIW